MATDPAAIVANLTAVVPFAGRRVVAVGVGGGQFVTWASDAAEVVAVDCDPAALDALMARAATLGLAHRFRPVVSDLMAVRERADLVLFEFSLHEMADPGAALDHALRLAPEVAVIDHAPGSRWAWHVVEETKVAAAWAAIEARRPLTRTRFETDTRFSTYDELLAKVRSQGEEAGRRAASFAGCTSIVIPLAYAIARLRRPLRQAN